MEVIDGAGVFVGRPYLTVITDVATRSIVGFCLTLEKPSVLSVALCLAQAMCPKDTWLAARNLNHAWPMFGRPQLLVTDSAMEFKGHAFQRGCDDYGIRIRYRDRGRVHQGGVVERLLGKLNAVLATYPGSSGRSVAHRDEYPSERHTCVSFADLERCVALAVIDHNLQENSKTLKVPMTEWQRNATALPRNDDAPQRVLLSFLPGTERQLSPQGISMFAMHYYSPWLSAIVPERDRLGRLEVRYDPRDISHVYVRDPETRQFRPVERRDGQLTSVTLWEHEAERTRRRAANHRSSTEKVAIRRDGKALCGHEAAGAVARRASPAPEEPLAGGGLVAMVDHLLEHVRPYLDRDQEERIAYIRAPRWIGHHAAQDSHRRLAELLLRPPSLRTQGLMLVGPYANGKTMIAERFAVEHLRTSPKQRVWIAQTREGAGLGHFYASILQALRAPGADMWNLGRKAEQLDHLLASVRPRVLIFGEFHNALRGRARDVEAVFAFLRRIGRQYDISPVLIGEVAVCDFINATSEMASRFDLVAVPRWQYDENYLMLLDSLEAALPLAKSSDLSTEPLARLIFSLSEGLIGEIVTIVTKAAVAAIRSGSERITKTGIDELHHVPVSQRRSRALRESLL